MDFVREKYVQLCLACFVITSGFGVAQTLWPRFLDGMLGINAANTFTSRILGIAMAALGLCYLLAIIYEEARKPLLMVATTFFALDAAYELVAVIKGQVCWLALGDVILGSAIVAFGVLAILMPPDTQS